MAAGYQSRVLFERACKVIPGGVNSPVRAFRQVGGDPLFITKGQGPFIFDADGRRYIDYVGSWGPLILGHSPQVVRDALLQTIERGTSFGAPTDLEVEFAELLTEILPSIEMIRFVSSGTEATMSAVRLARGYTGRDAIIKFNGCYHGHADLFLVKAGSGVATLGIAGSPGVPEPTVRNTLSIEFNDLPALEQTLSEVGADKVAAIIVEPVPGNMGLVLPQPGFLKTLRELCTKHGIVLIFDEVMTGFRVGLQGAQGRFGITPDLTTFGKVIGGGMPVGAFGGRADIMAKLAPSGPVYQAGTLSGNPLAMAAGMAAVNELIARNPYQQFEERSARWLEGMQTAANERNIPFTASACGSMIGFFFSAEPIKNFAAAQKTDTTRFTCFFQLMLEEGVYLAPSAFEAGFLSTEHTDEIIESTINAARRAFSRL